MSSAPSTEALLATAATGVLANGVAYGLWFAIVRPPAGRDGIARRARQSR